jgi:hypothetical protein
VGTAWLSSQVAALHVTILKCTTVEITKNASLAVSFATLYISGKVILNNFFYLFLMGYDIAIYVLYIR